MHFFAPSLKYLIKNAYFVDNSIHLPTKKRMQNQESKQITFQHGARQIKLDLHDLRRAASFLHALKHPLRQQIIGILEKESKKNVTDIFIALRVEQSVASQHLGILRNVGVVKAGRKGKFVHYVLNKDKLRQINQLLTNLTREKHENTEK